VSITSEPSRETPRSTPRVHAQVALGLLEGLRDQDRPPEILDDENLTLTLPRRLGLSDVVDTQIRRYRDDARRRRRIPDEEALGLIQLVIRRPDSDELFLQLGADLHGDPGGPGLRRFLPRRVLEIQAGRGVRRRLRNLFGRRMVTTATGPFSITARDDLLIRGDPGGDACCIVTGLARCELERFGIDPRAFRHVECRGRGDERCRWSLPSDDPALPPDAPTEDS